MQSRRKFKVAPLCRVGLSALGLLLSCCVPLPSWAAPEPTRGSEATIARAAAPPRTGSLRVEAADELLKALTHRSLVLQERAGNRPRQGTNLARAHAGSSDSPNTSVGQDPLARLSTYRAIVDGGPTTAPRPRAPLASRGLASHRFRSIPSPAADLAGYLEILSRTSPGGVVTGRFSDWRSPSIYRLLAGRHNGYDVALRAGTPAVVGWPGRVTAVTPWYGREYGITVTSPDGFHTTYGHLAPCVKLGTWLEPGDVVGIVVVDHVDIKMRDAKGTPVDFARGVPMEGAVAMRGAEKANPGLAVSVPETEPGRPSPSSILQGPDWTLKPEAVKAAIAYLRLRYQEASILTGYGLKAMLPQVQKQVAETRSRLLLYGVPEEVLMAAFLESPQLQSAAFTMGDGGDVRAGADLLGEWLRRQQVTREAREANTQLKDLVKALRD